MDIDKISTYLKTLKDLKAAKTKIHVAESSIISLVVAEYGEEVLSAIHSIAEYDKVTALRMYRDFSKCTLREAKEYIDSIL